MKKTINKLVIIGVCSLVGLSTSCSNKKEEKSTVLTTNEIIQQVDTVIAIGKVSAENGTAIISSNNVAMIQRILIKEGDTVHAGDLLIQLTNNLANVDIDLAKTKLQSVQEQNQITQKDIDREQISLSQLKQKYKTSQSLYNQQAETKENFLIDESTYLQQLERVAGLQKQLKVNQSQVKEQQLNIDRTTINLSDYNITAPQAGIISNLSAQIGKSVNSNESLGEIIDTKYIIIEAEVDELFADRIAVGQEVSFININTKQNLGKGIITYTSPTLVNKSILYEMANEGNDRRVLPIKIKPTSNERLLINAKVECQIKIK